MTPTRIINVFNTEPSLQVLHWSLKKYLTTFHIWNNSVWSSFIIHFIFVIFGSLKYGLAGHGWARSTINLMSPCPTGHSKPIYTTKLARILKNKKQNLLTIFIHVHEEYWSSVSFSSSNIRKNMALERIWNYILKIFNWKSFYTDGFTSLSGRIHLKIPQSLEFSVKNF